MAFYLAKSWEMDCTPPLAADSPLLACCPESSSALTAFLAAFRFLTMSSAIACKRISILLESAMRLSSHEIKAIAFAIVFTPIILGIGALMYMFGLSFLASFWTVLIVIGVVSFLLEFLIIPLYHLLFTKWWE